MTFEDRAIEYFITKAKDKYLAGKQEHGQGLDDVGLDKVMEELEGEVIDLVFYFYRVHEGLQDVSKALHKLKQMEADWTERLKN